MWKPCPKNPFKIGKAKKKVGSMHISTAGENHFSYLFTFLTFTPHGHSTDWLWLYTINYCILVENDMLRKLILYA